MQIQGNLSETSFPDLLQTIYSRGDATGVLDVIHEPVKKRFYFKEGVPVGSTSNVLGEVLGRLLMDEGIITQDDYEGSLEKVIDEKRRHGEVLISMGLITEERLEEFLKLQLKRRALNMFTWEEGTFKYVKTESLPEGLSMMPMHPGRLILEGISLGFYPAARIMDDISPYLDRRMTYDPLTSEAYNPDEMQLNIQEQRFLARFDGSETVSELLDSSDLLRHRAVSIALTVIMTGMIKDADDVSGSAAEGVSDAAPETRMGAELMFMRAKSALLIGNFREAADILTQITELNPVEAEYWAYLGWAVFNTDPSEPDKAEQILKDAIDLNNDLDRAWYFLGMLFLSKGDTEWARRGLATAVEKNPWLLSALAELKRMDISTKAGTGDARRYPEEFLFTKDPFTPAPTADLLIEPASQEDALVSLARAIKKRSGPVLLTGPRGAGKTTVVLELLRRLSNEKVLAAVVLDPPDRELELIRAINREAGSETDSRSIKEQLLSLGMRLSQNKIQGGHNLIIIDDAHTLTPGCLKLIQYLSRLKTLQVMLVSEPGLAQKLEDKDYSELLTKIDTRVELGPLSKDETLEFMAKRLTVAAGYGYHGAEAAPFVIDDSLLAELYEASEGMPGAVCRHASTALASGAGITMTSPAHAGPSSAAWGQGGQGAQTPETASPEAAMPAVEDTQEEEASTWLGDATEEPLAGGVEFDPTGTSSSSIEESAPMSEDAAEESAEYTVPSAESTPAGTEEIAAGGAGASGTADDWLEFDTDDKAAGAGAETDTAAASASADLISSDELTIERPGPLGTEVPMEPPTMADEPGVSYGAGAETGDAGFELTGSDFYSQAAGTEEAGGTEGAEAPGVDLTTGLDITEDTHAAHAEVALEDEEPGWLTNTDPTAAAEAFLDSASPADLSGVGAEDDLFDAGADFDTSAEGVSFDAGPVPSTPVHDREVVGAGAAGAGAATGAGAAVAETVSATVSEAAAAAAAATGADLDAQAAVVAAAVAKQDLAELKEQAATNKKAKKAKKPRGFIRLFIWVIVMLIAGLVVGSAIGVFFHGTLDTIFGTLEPPATGSISVAKAPAPPEHFIHKAS